MFIFRKTIPTYLQTLKKPPTKPKYETSYMRILALSDIHGLLPLLVCDDIDCVMIAGDICPTNNHSYNFQKKWLELEFYKWIEAIPSPVFLTLGNHDFVDEFVAPPNLHYGTQCIIDNALLFSWTPSFRNWAWMTDERMLDIRLDTVLKNYVPPIWLVHGPPHGTCDEVRGEHQGSKALRRAIELHQPNLVICGHLHEGSPEDWIGDSKIINVSLLNDEYIQVREPVYIDIEIR